MTSKLVVATLAILGVVAADDFSSYFNQFSEFKPPGGGSFPTMPSGFGEVPVVGGGSASSSSSSSAAPAPTKRQTDFNEYFNKVSEFKPPGGGSFPTMPSGFNELPGGFGGSSSSSSSSSAAPAPAPTKRQTDFNEYFNKVSEFKPPGGGSFPTMPSGFNELPGGFGGSSSSSSSSSAAPAPAPTKRQTDFNEYFNKVSEFKPPGGGSFPTMPSGFNELPGGFGGSSSSSSSSSAAPAPTKRQTDFNEYFNKVSEFKPPGGGSFPTMPSGFNELPGGFGGSSSSSSSSSAAPAPAPTKRQTDVNEYFNQFSSFKPPGGGSFPTMPSGFNELPGGFGGSSSSSSSSSAAPAPTKRQTDFNEYFNKVSEFKPPGGGSFPTMPSGAIIPGNFGGPASSSSSSSAPAPGS